ncbi:MAG: GNAT family N-acetyltransferase [FCB group bacterium]|nr:GNAT family N-acetyltransferase [FCB group bacterium]MBL7027688.1 GNAT family N-acetyltransferase [Candidatus Neomarinimicrobiota bacterium]MBL7121065.1 GNAT family N-acetyltransferase [Candidatus Neomarinimicrobiota bacterium]
MELELKTCYWDNAKARDAFKVFILEIHGLDFTEWESHGYWDSAYTPFSFFKDGQVVSSVCIYLLDAVIADRQTKLVQISGVGTHKDWRRQGLSRELTDQGLNWARGQHEGVFLFADVEAIPYYERCGFSPLHETLEYCHPEPVPNRPGMIQLDPSNQENLDNIYRYAQNRTPISHKFSVFSSQLLMFHALYTMRNKMYEIPDLACLVFFDREGDVVNVYDILGRTIPSFEKIYPYLSAETDRRINFHFHTDKLETKGIQTEIITGNNTFVKESFPVSTPAFPFTSRA